MAPFGDSACLCKNIIYRRPILVGARSLLSESRGREDSSDRGNSENAFHDMPPMWTPPDSRPARAKMRLLVTAGYEPFHSGQGLHQYC